MKYILSSIFLLLFASCNSQTEKMTSSLGPFMESKFPNSTFEIVKADNLHKLIINDEGSTMQKDNLESLMAETLGNFYLSFYHSSSSAATNSKFVISYKSKNLSCESESYDLFELGEMYNLDEE